MSKLGDFSGLLRPTTKGKGAEWGVVVEGEDFLQILPQPYLLLFVSQYFQNSSNISGLDSRSEASCGFG